MTSFPPLSPTNPTVFGVEWDKLSLQVEMSFSIQNPLVIMIDSTMIETELTLSWQTHTCRMFATPTSMVCCHVVI
ncbi:hypothetical protein IMY05_006G0033700 [Salix suchowensis]|nr:hypothetical protein IMY05_006G0033700 [Salix suchowensis]